MIEERISDPVLGHRTISYTYDPVGNRLTKNDNSLITEYSYDANDRLLTETGSAYTYDKNGNLLTKNGNGEEWQLTYNALNQVEHADISTSQGTSSLAYTYDHDGIRKCLDRRPERAAGHHPAPFQGAGRADPSSRG